MSVQVRVLPLFVCYANDIAISNGGVDTTQLARSRYRFSYGYDAVT